jgi:hypothetical protein
MLYRLLQRVRADRIGLWGLVYCAGVVVLIGMIPNIFHDHGLWPFIAWLFVWVAIPPIVRRFTGWSIL